MKAKVKLLFVCNVAVIIISCCTGAPGNAPESPKPKGPIYNISNELVYAIGDDLEGDEYGTTANFAAAASGSEFEKISLAMLRKNALNALLQYRDLELDARKTRAVLIAKGWKPTDKTNIHPDQIEDAKAALFFKFLAAVNLFYIFDNSNPFSLKSFESILQPYVQNLVLREKNSLHLFAKILNDYDHRILIWYLKPYQNGIEYFCYIYTAIVEASPHLNNRFTLEMATQYNDIRHVGNAFHLEQTIAKFKSHEYKNRFPMELKLLRTYRLSTDEQHQFHLNAATLMVNQVAFAFIMYTRYGVRSAPDFKERLARVYCAIRDLDGTKFNELVTKTGLSLAPFQISSDVPFAKTLYESLAELCKNSKVEETDIYNIIGAVDEIIKIEYPEEPCTKKEDVEKTFKALIGAEEMEGTKIGSSTHDKLKDALGKQIKKLENKIDLKHLIKLWNIVINLNLYRIEEHAFSLFTTHFHMVKQPELFVKIDEINELLQMSKDFVRANSVYASFKVQDAAVFDTLLTTLRQNLDNLITLKAKNEKEKLIRQRMCVAIELGLINTLTYSPQQVSPERITQALASYDALARKDDDLFYITMIMNEFSGFEYEEFLHTLYRDNAPYPFDYFDKPISQTNISPSNNIVIYYRILSLVDLKPELRNNIPDTILNNVIELEREFETKMPKLSNAMGTVNIERKKFHTRYAAKIREKFQDDVVKYVNMAIDIILTDRVKKEDLYVLEQIYIALESNKTTVLPAELANKLFRFSEDYQKAVEELSQYDQPTADKFKNEILPKYENWMNRLEQKQKFK